MENQQRKTSKRLVVNTTDEEHKALKRYVLEEDITISDLVRSLIVKHLENKKKTAF